MRTMQRPGGTAGVAAGSHFRPAQPAPGSIGVVDPRPFGQHVLPFGPLGFRHNLRSHVFVGNTCFGGPFFCRSFFFRRRFLFAQPLFLPYPDYTAQSYQDAGQAPEGATDQDYDLAEEVGRLAGEVEQLRDEQRVSAERAQRPLDRRMKTRQEPRFWSFATVVETRFRTMPLSAVCSGCSRHSRRGKSVSPISTLKPQRRQMAIVVSSFSSHDNDSCHALWSDGRESYRGNESVDELESSFGAHISWAWWADARRAAQSTTATRFAPRNRLRAFYHGIPGRHHSRQRDSDPDFRSC
jgi:hypothetical protein